MEIMDQLFLTKRNRPTLEHAGFLYVFHQMSKGGGIKFWRCQHFNSKTFNCHGRLHSDLEGNVIAQRGEHSCPTTTESIAAQRAAKAIKREAKEQKMKLPSTPQTPTKNDVKKRKIVKMEEEHEQDALAMTVNQMVNKLRGHGMALCQFRRKITGICLDFDEWLAAGGENQNANVNMDGGNVHVIIN